MERRFGGSTGCTHASHGFSRGCKAVGNCAGMYGTSFWDNNQDLQDVLKIDQV